MTGGAQTGPLNLMTRPAARDLSSYQYCFMQLNTDGQWDYVDTSSSGVALGILQNKPDAAGKAAEVALIGSRTLVKVNGNSPNIDEGDPLGSDSDYQGTKVSTDGAQFLVIAVEPSTADDDLIEGLIVGPNYLYVAQG